MSARRDPVPQVLAALANPRQREMYAHVVLGTAPEEPTARHRRSLDGLSRAGLVTRTDGRWVPTDVFRELLADRRSPAPRGPERFLADGRIVTWPSRTDDKLEVLDWVLRRCLDPEESIPETVLNQRLAEYTADPALVRRYCVDAGMLRRTADGSVYSRTTLPRPS